MSLLGRTPSHHRWGSRFKFQLTLALIRHEWMSKYGQTREKDLYKKIKEEVRGTPQAIEYITNLREAANIYDAIRSPDHDIWAKFGPKCTQLIEEIALLGPIQCYPLILSTYFSMQKELPTILMWITNLTVRYSIICAKGTGNLETAYAKASSTMRKSDSKIKDVKKVLLNIWPNDDEFKSSFKEKTLSSPRIIKYLLCKIELAGTADKGLIPNPGNLSVEHILPKKPGSEWPRKMRAQEYLKTHVSKIGNLTILTEPMNREVESREFSFKKIIYQNSTYSLSKDLCKIPEWTETEIEKRQEDLANHSASIWVI